MVCNDLTEWFHPTSYVRERKIQQEVRFFNDKEVIETPNSKSVNAGRESFLTLRVHAE